MSITLMLVGLLATGAQAPSALHCRITLAAGAPSETCRVTVPTGKRLRACADADRQAGHCDAAGGRRFVAWVVGTGPGRCHITTKKTDWDRTVRAKLSKSAGASSCDLYVEVQ